MNASHISKTDVAALVELAESKFYAWHLKELRPERDRRISELRNQNLTSGGRAVSAMRIYRELLEREVRKRIGFYAESAHESGNAEMLSEARLDELRQRITTLAGAAIAALKVQAEMDARRAGDLPESALPNRYRYVLLQSEILDVANAELRVLAAESGLSMPEQTHATLASRNAVAPGVAQSANMTNELDGAHRRSERWEDIEVSFLSDERVQIRIGNQTETRNYSEIGFENRKNGAPVLAWETLRELAKAGGVIRIASDSRRWAKLEKRIQEIRAKFKGQFGLADDPIPFTKKKLHDPDNFGYHTKFKVFCRPSYES